MPCLALGHDHGDLSLAIQQWPEQEDRERQSLSVFQITDGDHTCHGYVVLMCRLELCLRALTSRERTQSTVYLH